MNDDINAGVNRALLRADIVINGQVHKILTTHFTWTPAGSVTDEQRQNLQKMLDILSGLEPFVLTGDFNAPRGKEIFDKLAEAYTDWVPQHYTTSIDQNLHRAKGLQFMVDGLFTSPEYQAKNVRMIEGVSDHQAIVADLQLYDR